MLTVYELRDVAEAIRRRRQIRLLNLPNRGTPSGESLGDVESNAGLFAAAAPHGEIHPGDGLRRQARPGSTVRALVPQGDGLVVGQFTWGFDLPSNGKLVFNTRIESALAGSPLWADAFASGRCILPAATFFEPHRTETVPSMRTGRMTKRQYEFSHPDGEPLLLASLVHDGRLSVLTTEPDETVAPIHPRMPLVLRFGEAGAWLAGNFAAFGERVQIGLIATPEQARSASLSHHEQLTLF